MKKFKFLLKKWYDNLAQANELCGSFNSKPSLDELKFAKSDEDIKSNFVDHVDSRKIQGKRLLTETV